VTPPPPATLAEERPSVVVKQWPHSPRSVGRARLLLAQHLGDWGLSHLADTAEVIVSELFTNSVRHACEPRGRLWVLCELWGRINTENTIPAP